MEHLLVHYQNRDPHQIIRIIRIMPIRDLDAYKAEISSVYKTLEDDMMHLFFNVSDMSGRLVSDIGFKSFKGCGKLEKINDNLFKIPTKAPVDFFSAMFLPWAKGKIADYVTDLDETYVINTEDLKTSPFTTSEVAQFVHVQFDDGGIFYNLLNCHKTEDEYFVLSEHHLKALFTAYAKNNKSRFGPHRKKGGTVTCREDANGLYIPYEPGEKHEEIVYECIRSVHEWPESYFTDKPFVNPKLAYVLSSIRFSNLKHNGPPVKIGEVAYGKGITVSKIALTNQDIDVLIEHLGITEALNKALSDLILNNDVIEFNEITGYDGLLYASVDSSWGSLMGYSSSPYALFIETETESSLNVCEPRDPKAVSNVSNVSNVPNVEKSHIFYKDVITNDVRCFKNEIKYLPEFQRLGDVMCKSPMVHKIIDNFVSNDTHDTFDIDHEVVTELTTLTTMMSSFFSDEKNEQSNEQVHDHQYELTKAFVNQYKSDKGEISATIAVENVYGYLMLRRVQEINKNRIGSDLVDLGVKKTRKSRGYVYGLKDCTGLLCKNTNTNTNTNTNKQAHYP